MKKATSLASLALLLAHAAFATQGSPSKELLFQDAFDGRSTAKTTEVAFKDGVAVLDSPKAKVEYPAAAFATRCGRIEFEVKLTKPLAADHKFWCLFSDVGAGGSHPGAINVHWRDGSSNLEFLIFDGKAHHSCVSKTSDWRVGTWYRLAFNYGTSGMALEVDGKAEATDPYPQGLSDTPKRIGFHDDFVEAPPVMVRKFRTYRVYDDYLAVTPLTVSPNGDGLYDTATITYGVARPSAVTIEVTGPDGKTAARLLLGAETGLGDHSVTWTPKGLAPGIYRVHLSARTPQSFRTIRREVTVVKRPVWKKSAPAFNSFFPLGTWYFAEEDASYINLHMDDSAKAEAYYRSTMKELADNGFNLIFPVWTPHDHRKMMLDAAGDNGIKAILHLDEVDAVVARGTVADCGKLYDIADEAVRSYRDHPALAGYYIIDEPWNTPDQTERIKLAKRVLEAMDPKHPGFSCLLNAYESTLAAVDYQALVIDVYPIGQDWKGDFSKFISETERGRRNAGERPLWVILQAFGTPGGWRVPTPAEVETQVWLSLASGAKGIVYFIYQSTTRKQGESIQGMVDMDLKRTDDRLAAIGRINAEVKKLAPVLLTLKSGSFALPQLPSGVHANAFVDRAGRRFVILANKSATAPVSVPWSVGAVDVLTGRKVTGSFTLSPGKGKVLRLD